MYRKRAAEAAVKKLSEMFGAILVAGPRQVGKTTMLRNIANNIPVRNARRSRNAHVGARTRRHVFQRQSAARFHRRNSKGARAVRANQTSYRPRLQKRCVLYVRFTTVRDDERRERIAFRSYGSYYTSRLLVARNAKRTFRHAFPSHRRVFFRTKKCAGISQPTAERWLSVLVASNIVYLLQPYFNNVTKRAIKTPKLYFLDTGLAAYLTKWNTPEVLKNGAMAGAFFESFVIAEIIKSYYNRGISDPPLYFYRDKEMHEIDLLIESNGTLHPVEIKKHADPTKKDVEAFDIIDKIPQANRGSGGIVCLYDNLVTLTNNDKVIPIRYL